MNWSKGARVSVDGCVPDFNRAWHDGTSINQPQGASPGSDVLPECEPDASAFRLIPPGNLPPGRRLDHFFLRRIS